MSQAHAFSNDASLTSSGTPRHVSPKPGAHLSAVAPELNDGTSKNKSPLIVAIKQSESRKSPLFKALMKITVFPWLNTLKDITRLSYKDLLAIQEIDASNIQSIVTLLCSYNLVLAVNSSVDTWRTIGRVAVPPEFIENLTLDRLVPELNRYLRHNPHWVHGLLLLSVNERDIKDLERVNIKCIQDLYSSMADEMIRDCFPRTVSRTYWADRVMVVSDRLIAIVKAFIGLLADAGISGSQFA